MDKDIFEFYKKFTAFLGEVLGPDYEIALFDLTSDPPAAAFIHNGFISGRTAGSPMMSTEQRIYKDGTEAGSGYAANYRGFAANGKTLRCSGFFIKDKNGADAGLLTVNFDDSKYLELSHTIFAMAHPDSYIKENISISLTEHAETGNLSDSITNALDEAFLHVTGKTSGLLTYEQKLDIVGILNQKNVFRIKGAVPVVAKRISSSQASVYRYLSEVRYNRSDQDAE